jgi:hypothetical protein
MKTALTYGLLLLTDFTANSPDLGWFILNDNVMGGRSEGTFEWEGETLRFMGNTNTNGGGFSSIRAESMQLDLANHTGIRLRVKGDGRRYTWRLVTTARWRGRQVNYWADFDTRDGEWTTIDIPFSRFVPKFRGYRLPGPALDTTQITGMGLMIYDNRDGPFELELDSVHAYAEAAVFSLSEFQWERRVLVVSAGSGTDDELTKQLNELEATREEFADRDMLLVTLRDDAVATAGTRELTQMEVDAVRRALGIRDGTFALRLIGKDGSVKFSADRATPVAEIYDLIDGMPMRRRELSGRR